MDANFVMTDNGDIVEVQATAEDRAVSWEQVVELKQLAAQGIAELTRLQLAAVSA